MRLDKYLYLSYVDSKKDISLAIKKRQVLVNKEVCLDEKRELLENDEVIYKNNIVNYKENYYFMLNKPAGYICATSDSSHKTVIELFNLPKRLKENLKIVGRLDIDTEGLLIVTTDGNLVHHLTSPKREIPKVYYVEHLNHLKNNPQDLLNEPIVLKNETFKPCLIEEINENKCLLTVTEGKFHEVKRIIHYLGSEVLYLKRIKINNLELPTNLNVGSYIELNKNDLEKLGL